MKKKIVLTTLPREGSAVQWVAPDFFVPKDSKYLPLGLLSLATNVSPEHEVVVLDPHSRNWSLDKTIEAIEAESPDILGISAMALKAYQMVEVLKRTSAPYKVVGGPHVTKYAELILSQGAHAVFRGQLADKEFAEAVESSSMPTGIVECNTRINETQFPRREGIDNEFYYGKGNLFESNKRMSMFSGVGCPHHCRFCDVQTKNVERRKTQTVLDEMEYLKSLGAGSIHIYEDNFNTEESYLRELCAGMDKRRFHTEWSGRGQARMSPEISQMLADHGFKRIHVGIESTSNTTLRWFRKPQNYDSIRRFCDTVYNAGIDVIGFFIVGAPTETEEDRRTMGEKIKALHIKYPLINILQPLPDTEYYSDLIKQRIYKKDHWKNYLKNPTPNYMLPFPYGKEKWEEDAAFVQKLIEEFYPKSI